MSPRRRIEFSPYRHFSRAEWARLRAGTPMTLDESDIERLAGICVQLSMDEVEEVYLPLSRLLNLYVEAAQGLHAVTSRFLHVSNGESKGESNGESKGESKGERSGESNGAPRSETEGSSAGGAIEKIIPKTPFIIGLAGSVAVGKSTSARVLQALLSRWPNHPRVDLVTTDGFLLPNRELEARNLMHRKGFPESYDTARLLNFLADVKAGRRNVSAPIYSHFHYDVMEGEKIVVDRPDILILEGLNVLQPAKLPRHGEAIPFVSDFFDFSIYLDADARTIGAWYVERFMQFRATAFRDPAAYFHQYSKLREAEARATAWEIWRSINLKNLEENILPTRQRADLILRKGADHRVESVKLRKL